MADLTAWAEEFGANPQSLRYLDSDEPEILPYSTLITEQRTRDSKLDIVRAVYEWQGDPLVFLVDADSVEGNEHLHQIRRLLAMRGDAPYLGVLAPGSLEVYRIALDSKSLPQVHISVKDDAFGKTATFSVLSNLRPNTTINKNWISNVVLRLLRGSTSRLIELGVSHEDAISLVGRALFTRFLADRDLLPRSMSDPRVTAELFDTRRLTKATSNWLDEVFNGDLLPLSSTTIASLPKDGFPVLGDILRKAPDGQLFLGWEQKWGNLDFAHIPVGVLSQAYELYLRDHEPQKQRREGGYFTPRVIAELMVRASFRALDRGDQTSSATILDPAVGGGMFLLTAFRELVAARWRDDRKRPDTKTLRQILYTQLVGFDVNESALRFAALGLYLLSIELDPNPKPVDKLRFDDLRGTVLHLVASNKDIKGKELGSLGTLVGEEHNAQYDLVIGNPPWSSSTNLPNWDIVLNTVSRISAERGVTKKPPPIPNEGMDLPFVWRAMEWAKPNGQIAFALHARWLFQQGYGMPKARQALFEALDITSIINGAELRQTNVWPQISAPFCVLFATNRKRGTEGAFRFISPRMEVDLNRAGAMRVDSLNSDVLTVQQLVETPELLKIMFKGSKADLGIIERIRAAGHPTLGAFWGTTFGYSTGNRLRGSGNGFQKIRASSQVRKHGDGLPGVDAKYLQGKPELNAATFDSVFIDTQSLGTFSHDRITNPRSADLFVGPLMVVHKSPPAKKARIRVAVSEQDVVYNESFYGYSPVAHSQARLLSRYLTLILGSRFVVWLVLMTSGEFGFERDVIEKATIDRIPMPDFDSLSQNRLHEIDGLFEGLQTGEVSWVEVDKWVVNLYGLGERDLQVISDTLKFNLPFGAYKRNAREQPRSQELQDFCDTLREELTPWCDRFGETIIVKPIELVTMWPWQVISVQTVTNSQSESAHSSDWLAFMKEADATASSEIIFNDKPGVLQIGRLDQSRYWSKTQARLLAQRIVWSHGDSLKNGG